MQKFFSIAAIALALASLSACSNKEVEQAQLQRDQAIALGADVAQHNKGLTAQVDTLEKKLATSDSKIRELEGKLAAQMKATQAERDAKWIAKNQAEGAKRTAEAAVKQAERQAKAEKKPQPKKS